MKKVKSYLFNVTLRGVGTDADKAWQDAVEQFALDAGATPEDYKDEGRIL